MSGPAATTAAASSTRPWRDADGLRKTTKVARSTRIETSSVITRAAAGTPASAPRNV